MKGGGDHDRFADERERLGHALDDAQAHLGLLIQHAVASMDEARREEVYKAGLHTTALLESLAEVTIGWLLLRQAEIAQDALDAGASGTDEEFYTGKVAAARYFARAVLPKTGMRRRVAEEEDGALMALPAGAF